MSEGKLSQLINLSILIIHEARQEGDYQKIEKMAEEITKIVGQIKSICC